MPEPLLVRRGRPGVTAFVVPPDDSWGTRRVLATALEALGYRVDEMGAGRHWVLLLR